MDGNVMDAVKHRFLSTGLGVPRWDRGCGLKSYSNQRVIVSIFSIVCIINYLVTVP